jgi:hypothetical protein
VAELLVTLRQDHGEARDVCRWSEGDVRALLLDVLPRRVMLEDAPAETAVPTPKALLRFLEGSRRMHRHCAGLGALLEEADGVASTYADAMLDPARAGAAQSLVSAMRADGVDVTDAEAVRQWQLVEELEQAGRTTSWRPSASTRPPPATRRSCRRRGCWTPSARSARSARTRKEPALIDEWVAARGAEQATAESLMAAREVGARERGVAFGVLDRCNVTGWRASTSPPTTCGGC